MIIRSAYPSVTIPEVPLTQFVLHKAKTLGDKPALIDGSSGVVITYAELQMQIRRAASGLHARGFRKGECLAIFSPNVPEYAVIFHAVALLGGVITTINPLYTLEELVVQLIDAGAKWLFTVPAFREKAKAAAAQAGVGEIIIKGPEEKETIAWTDLLATGDKVPDVSIDPCEDVVALPYSSGTTGLPKGVMLTHYNLVANLLQIEASGHMFEDDVLLCVLPLFHIYGMMVILNQGLYCGATIVLLPRFDFEQYLTALQDYRVTFAHVVPPMMLLLAKDPRVDRYDLSSLRRVFSAAAPLAEEVLAACEQRLDCEIRQGYGMTEASPATHMGPWEPERNRMGTVGFCVSNTECKIVDSKTGELLGCNEEGEIWIRGPQIMKGYLNCADATAASICDGWLRTGDIGTVDENGRFRIVDRVKELIKYKGFQIAPAELEALLLRHPEVADAAVVPMADEEAGEVPKAFVVRRSEISAEDLLSFVARNVAPFKKIRSIEFVDQIPKSPSGKILRRMLRARSSS